MIMKLYFTLFLLKKFCEVICAALTSNSEILTFILFLLTDDVKLFRIISCKDPQFVFISNSVWKA